MASLMRGFLFVVVSALTLASAWPASVEAGSAFFFQAPRNYNRTYYSNQPYNPYQRPYGGYYRPQIYQDPRADARYMNAQTPSTGPDYYQQYENWWQR